MEEPVFIHPPGQNFACRDCPSRCCKNWTVDITASDVARFRSEEWIQSRLQETGTSFLRLGGDHFLLPVIEVERQMRCVFLEPDGLCGMHRRYGHDFLASSCQTFPFDFIEDENEKIIVVASRVCPSIRENYGDPLEPILKEKFEQSGGIAKKQSPFLLLGAKTRLNLRQYSAIFAEWEKLISAEESVPLALALCHRLLESLAAKWRDRAELGGEEFQAGLKEAEEELGGIREQTRAELAAEGQGSHRVAEVMQALACLPLTYPLRSRVLFQGAARARYLSGVLKSLIALLTMKGTIDAIHLGASIPLDPRLRKNRVLGANELEEIRGYLLRVLSRRKFAMQPGALEEILFVLIMVPTSCAFFAKLSAAGRNAASPERQDFREAISALEMSVLHQGGFMGSSGLFRILLPLILANPKTLIRLLMAEIANRELSGG